MIENNAGKKLNGDVLYQQQQEKSTTYAPAILACNLQGLENIGALYRLADAAGCNRIIFIQKHKKTYQNIEKVTFTSRCANQKITTEYWSMQDFIEKNSQLPMLVALELTSKATSVFTTAMPYDCCFVIGSESYGIDNTVLNYCQSAVQIPMFGINGSMNVTHALAICLYEWHRQHTIN